jgi:hypothetical protein
MSERAGNGYKVLGPEDIMPFGKHKGFKIRSIIMNDYSWVKWALENTSLMLDNDAYKMFQKVSESYE